MKSCFKTLVAAFISLAGVMALNAKVFEKSYDTYGYGIDANDYKIISEMLFGPGVSQEPGGELISQAGNSFQVGVFSNLYAEAVSSFSNGVILCTGMIVGETSATNQKVRYPWANQDLQDQSGFPTDLDLVTTFGKDLLNKIGIVLYVKPKNKTINIPYLMASEHFYQQDEDLFADEPWSSNLPDVEGYKDYSDKFAIFVKKISGSDDSSPMGPNIARFPNGENVGIVTVNQHTNTEYFISNVTTNENGGLVFPATDINLPMEYNGAIRGPVAVVDVEPGAIYKVKIVIGDSGDNLVNSALFLRAKGITSGPDLKIDATGPVYLPEPGPVTFTNTVSSDRWAAPADNVVVTNYLPAGVQKSMLTEPWCSTGEIDSGSWDKIDETGYFVWKIGSDFAAGSNAVMTIDCNLTDLGAGVYTNLATVATSDGDYDWSNNTDKCVTLVGGVKPLLTITAIQTNKVRGTKMVLPALQFVASAIDETDGTYRVEDIVKGVDVVFTNSTTKLEAYPTNAVDDVVGDYDIYLTNVDLFDEDAFRGVVCDPGLLRVREARHLHVYAVDTNKVYGSELSLSSLEFIAAIEGTNETEKVTGINVSFTNAMGEVVNPTNATATVGTYGIVISNVQGFATSAFTSITYHPGTLEVRPREVKFQIGTFDKNYGETVTFLGDEYEPVEGGILPPDEITNVKFASAGASATAPCTNGFYSVIAESWDGEGLENYHITWLPGILGINVIPITITANDVTNSYGGVSTFDGTEFTVVRRDFPNENLPNHEKIETVTLTNLLAVTTPVDDDPYENAIRPSHVVTGINTNNYDIDFVDGKLVITQAVLTITANSKTRPYGTTIPILKTDFTILPTELPNDETVTNVTIACPKAGIPLAPLGTYPIVPSHDVTGSLDTNNYNIVFVNGTLEVTPTVFTATPEPVTKYYDGAPTNIIVKLQGLPAPVTPTFEYSYAENDGYVPASSFTGPTNVEESAEVWCRAIAPGTTNTVHAKVTILPRVVVEQAESATRAYNGEPLTNAVHFFEGTAASNLAKSVYFDLAQHDVYDGPARDDWADAVGFVGANGFVRVPMTAVSTITDLGTQPNVIDPDAVTFTASTKTNNYVINYLDGQLTVTLSTALTLEVFDVEKFYDAESTNVAYVAKVGGTPIADATVELHEQGTVGWIPAADFVSYLDTTNVIVDVAVAKYGYVAVTNSATLLIKPRPVTLVAATDSKTYDGNPLTNWTFEVKADTTTPGYGFVTEADEGVERVEMTAASTITDPGTVDNVIAAKFAKAGTKLDRNYVVSTENGTLTVNPLGVLTVEASAAEKFYDAVPTNIAYVVKVDGTPTDDATVSLREKGTEAWIAADDFPTYLNATNATVQVRATKPGYLAATDEATVWVKPRIVVHHAESGKWEYDGTIHTQPDYFEDEDEESKLSKAKWGTDEVLPNSTGFVADEGYAARLVMTADSSIKDPGKKPNVIDQSPEKAALKAGTNPENYELHYLDGELEVTSTAELKTTVSASLNWNTGLFDLTLTVKNVGEGSVYPASDYWVELIPGPSGTGEVASVARTYYLNDPTGTLPNGADYINLTAAVRAALVSAGGDEIFGPGEEITLTGVSVYHWKRWSPGKFIDADAFFVAGPLSERTSQTPLQTSTTARAIVAMTSVVTGPSRSSLASDEAALAETTLASVYDGVLYDADALAGTIRVQLAKANKKTGLSKLTATLAPVGGKKVTLSGNFDPNAVSFTVTAKDGRALELSVGNDGLSGTFDGLEIDGARNRYSSKDADDKAVVAAADDWMGSYSMVSPSGNGWETYAVKVAKKGKVTIAGTLADGTTVSASAQMIIGAMGCCVPVVIAKKSVSRAFCIWFGEDGIGVDGLEDAIIGNGGNLTAVGTLTFDVGMLLSLLESDTVTVLSDYLPNGAEILPNGKKWVVMPDATGKALKTGSLVWDRKNGVINVEKSKIDGYNVSGLKLTYTATTGVFKGSFKVFEIVKGSLKTVTANLSGIVVDGVGYGTAKVGKFGTVAVMIE